LDGRVKERFLFPEGADLPSPRAVAVANDRAFEVAVLGAVRQELAAGAAGPAGARASLTPQSADRGRDIVVQGFSADRLLAMDLAADAPERSVYIECKLSGRRRLTLDHAAANVLQLEPESGSLFLLVTNSTLTPRTISTIVRQCERLDIDFRLIDAWSFADALPGLMEAAADAGDGPAFLVSYQILREEGASDDYLVHFVLRSLRIAQLRFEIAFHSTRDWKAVADRDGGFTLGRGEVAAWTLKLTPSGPRIAPSFSIALTIDGKRRIHEIPLVTRDEMVRLPLFPSDMSRCLAQLRERLVRQELAHLTHVHANAGLGKSRLLQELFDEARRQGAPSRLIRILNDGSALVETAHLEPKTQHKWPSAKLGEYLKAQLESPPRLGEHLIFLDDVHVLDAGLLEDIFTLAAGLSTGPRIVAAGRSDPAFRRPAHEAFAVRVAANVVPGSIEQYRFEEMTDRDLRAALSRLFEERTAGLLGLGGQTQFKPVDLVHAVHLLMERGHVAWTDEDTLRLTLAAEGSGDRFWGHSTLSGVLEERYKHLREVDLGGFSLAAFLEVFAAADDSRLSHAAVTKLLAERGVAPDLLGLWLEVDDASQLAPFRHSSLKDFLAARFYSFGNGAPCGSALAFMPGGLSALEPRKLAACALSAGNTARAASLISPFAAGLRTVTNISSLRLSEADYYHYATLFAVLASGRRIRGRLLHRCVVARAYLNSHHRAYSLGFIDNLRLIGLLEAIADFPGKTLAIAAVKQLMAHALINGGDARTALSLMHEVENLLELVPESRLAQSIEFDMCDRLQSYYAHQSAFGPARLFFFRARHCADRVGDPALLNLSFSAEFHLTRYLDVDNALRLADRQLRHAEMAAPPRALLHARVNRIVANWARSGWRRSPAELEELSHIASASRRQAFGHLVPRLDYLFAVDAFLRWRSESLPGEEVDRLLTAGVGSARQYGYEDYVWLLGSLELLKLAESHAHDGLITAKAIGLIDHLQSLGMAFIAGEELCFQNTVALSNALRALHRHGDQENAWRAAAKISFSPLFLPRAADRVRRIEAAFAGQMLNHNYDPRALIRNDEGYAVILV
jgi:hypothetical protein